MSELTWQVDYRKYKKMYILQY